MPAKSTDAARALVIEYVDPATLVPHPRNPRTITPSARAALKRGIEAFGLVDPLVVRRDTRTVLGGHQRLDVALELAHATVPVVWVDASDREADALLVLLNNPRAQGDWDIGALRDMLQEMNTDGFDLTLTGFDEHHIDQMMAEPQDMATAWAGLPEYEQQDQLAFRQVTVSFADDAAVAAFAPLPVTE